MRARENRFDNARRAERCELNVEIKLRRPTEPSVPSSITDLSRTGFRLQTFKHLKPGMELWVTLPGLESRLARVRWVRDFEAGCIFEHPLYEPVFRHLVRLNRSTGR